MAGSLAPFSEEGEEQYEKNIHLSASLADESGSDSSNEGAFSGSMYLDRLPDQDTSSSDGEGDSSRGSRGRRAEKLKLDPDVDFDELEFDGEGDSEEGSAGSDAPRYAPRAVMHKLHK